MGVPAAGKEKGMKKENLPKWTGLSAYQIKMLAVLTMTIDHLGAYGFEVPLFAEHKTMLRLIGRMAAPLFLFLLTESIRHTKNKARFLRRLYLGAVWVGLFVTVTNYIWADTIGRFRQSNILFAYFYIAVYCIMIELLVLSIKQREWKKGAAAVAGMLATAVPHYICVWIDNISFGEYGCTPEQAWTILDFVGSFVQSPLAAEYTILFVIMGVLMYFAKSKSGKAMVLVLFSLFCYFGGRSPALHTTMIQSVLGFPQYFMVLAVPVLLLYNGEKGKGSKYFFYLYYPLHRYGISVLAYVYRLFRN